VTDKSNIISCGDAVQETDVVSQQSSSSSD